MSTNSDTKHLIMNLLKPTKNEKDNFYTSLTTLWPVVM